MALIVNQGLRDIARHLLGIDLTVSLQAALWVAPNVPDLTDTINGYLLCTMSGYAPVFLNPNSWQQDRGNGMAKFVYPTITFNFDPYDGDEVTVYGYLVSNTVTNHLMWVEAFGTTYTVPNAGGSLPVTINFNVSNC